MLDISGLDKQTRFSVLHPKDGHSKEAAARDRSPALQERSQPELVYHAISKVAEVGLVQKLAKQDLH